MSTYNGQIMLCYHSIWSSYAIWTRDNRTFCFLLHLNFTPALLIAAFFH